jgi:hypothetical protein
MLENLALLFEVLFSILTLGSAKEIDERLVGYQDPVYEAFGFSLYVINYAFRFLAMKEGSLVGLAMEFAISN